jgi:hypothetical protein
VASVCIFGGCLGLGGSQMQVAGTPEI